MSIIAISRGTFSGGETLAKRVAERLGYQCLSREANLNLAAKAYGIPAEDLAAAMEKRPSFWHRVAGERTAHLAFVRATLCEQAREGRLVYHGLVGHLLLPGVSHVIRVRVIADMEFRIKAAMQQQNFGRADAQAYIETVDRERRQWIRFLFDVEWDDPHLYDVVLNLSRMSLAHRRRCGCADGRVRRVQADRRLQEGHGESGAGEPRLGDARHGSPHAGCPTGRQCR